MRSFTNRIHAPRIDFILLFHVSSAILSTPGSGTGHVYFKSQTNKVVLYFR